MSTTEWIKLTEVNFPSCIVELAAKVRVAFNSEWKPTGEFWREGEESFISEQVQVNV